MPEMLPWLVAPTKKEEFDELEKNMAALSDELYTKLQIIAAQTRHRLMRPKGGSKWAERLAWLRLDLRVYARAVTKPMAQAGAAAVAMGKAFRLSYTTFYEVHGAKQVRNHGDGGGFDFS